MNFIENGTEGRPALALIAKTARRIADPAKPGLGGDHNKITVPANNWKSMATYQTPAESASSPTTSCSSRTWASNWGHRGTPGTLGWSSHGRTSAATTMASASAAASGMINRTNRLPIWTDALSKRATP